MGRAGHPDSAGPRAAQDQSRGITRGEIKRESPRSWYTLCRAGSGFDLISRACTCAARPQRDADLSSCTANSNTKDQQPGTNCTAVVVAGI
eukprot:3120493-Rhodomonas_salina.1